MNDSPAAVRLPLASSSARRALVHVEPRAGVPRERKGHEVRDDAEREHASRIVSLASTIASAAATGGAGARSSSYCPGPASW
jgi:hypothetical protein